MTRTTRLRSHPGLLPALFLAMMGAGCADRDASGDGTAESAATREGVIDLTISESGGEESTFGRVGGVVVDRKGRIYVADNPANEIRVFGPDGRFLYRMGRKGQGPGEFDGPCCMALRDDDRTLWVRDGGNGRYVAFTLGDSGGTHRMNVKMAHGDVNRWAPLGFDPAGNLIDVGTIPRPFGTGPATPTVGRFHVDTAGRVVSVDTVPSPPEDSVPVHTVPRTVGTTKMIMYVHQPFGPSALVAHGPNGEWARAVSSRYSIAWHGADGRVLRTLERPLEAPPLSLAERALGEESIADDMKRTGVARGALPYDVPSRKQPLRGLVFDQDGRLWVQHSVAEGTQPRADVYGPDGRLLYEVTWPRRVDLTGASRGDEVYGVQRDSLDVPGIVRMKLAAPSSGR